jgi:hypothetical protein
MKLDNVAQITTSEIQVKAREGVPRGTGEESRRAGSGGGRERESGGRRERVVFQIKCRSFSYLLMKSISSASKLRQWQFWRTEICAAKDPEIQQNI